MFEPAYIKILDWNTVEDKKWNGIGWYGFIGVITTSKTDISLALVLRFLVMFHIVKYTHSVSNFAAFSFLFSHGCI